MTDRPFLFTGRMVRALLDDRKTQTRRLMTSKTSEIGSLPISEWSKLSLIEPVVALHDGKPRSTWVDNGNRETNIFCPRDREQYLHVPHVNGDTVHRVYCRSSVGDRIWVKETFRVDHPRYRRGPLPRSRPCVPRTTTLAPIVYAADVDLRVDRGPWRPGIFTKRWASRLTLPILEVRAQRLHEITAADALAEGVELDVGRQCPCRGDEEDPGPHIESCPYSFAGYDPNPFGLELPAEVREVPPAVAVFAALWDSINGDRPGASWHENPWVWALTFRVERAS